MSTTDYVRMILLIGLLAGCNTDKPDETFSISGILYSDGRPVSVSVAADGTINRIGYPRRSTLMTEYFIAPGLIDLQINGYMGVDFSDTAITGKDMESVTRALWSAGVTSFLPTVISNSDPMLQRIFTNIGSLSEDRQISKSIPGFHLEGPYLSPAEGFRGAHLEKFIRPPGLEEFMSYQELSGERIILVTLAPEIVGSIPLIRYCNEHGVAVSLGHHQANAVVVDQAVEAGARLSTHLGNGCANMIHRHHNPLWPQLSNDSLAVSIIADGHHLPREVVRSFYKVKGPEKTILVSDALDLAGLPPGEYIRGERTIVLTPGVAMYPAGNVLAGAATTLKHCVFNMMNFTGCSLKEAIQMASTNPARLLGLNAGEILPGKRADLILFQMDESGLEIFQTYVAGRLVYQRPE